MIDVNTDLIKRAQQGDTEIIGDLYNRFHVSIFRYLYYRVGDRQVAEDLTSEVFERMLRFIGGFRPPSDSFQAWLFQIARNLTTDYFRKQSVRNHVALRENLVANEEDIDMNIERTLTSESLRNALNQLNEDQRDVIIMRFVAGMAIADVAQALHKSEDSVKGLQRRALIGLRQTLTDWEVSYV